MKASMTCVAMAAAGLLVLGSNQGMAVSYKLSFSPMVQTVSLGGSAFVDVVAMETSGPGALGAIDFDVFFDPSIVSYVGFAGGTGFGPASTGLIGTPGLGFVNFFEISFELPADLVASQADPFVIGTLEFSADAVGVSPLSFGLIDAGDELGTSIASSTSLETGSIRVRAPGGSVPDGGSTALLLGLPLVGMLLGLKRMAPRNHC